MSVERNDYVMVGCNIINEIKEKYDDTYDFIEKIESDKDIDVVYDGMSGNYCMVGKIIDHIEMYEGFELKKLDLNEIENIKKDVSKILKDKFKEEYQPELCVFTHWY